MRRLIAKPSRPMSMALPTPSTSQPQPAQRCCRPCSFWPRAMAPVPLIKLMPACPGAKAPARAVRSSPVTSTASSPKAWRAKSVPRCWVGLSCSMPLAPMAAAAKGSRAAPPCRRAASRLLCSARPKRSGPCSLPRWLTPLPSPSATTRPSRWLRRQRVWVWPASKPASRPPVGLITVIAVGELPPRWPGQTSH